MSWIDSEMLCVKICQLCAVNLCLHCVGTSSPFDKSCARAKNTAARVIVIIVGLNKMRTIDIVVYSKSIGPAQVEVQHNPSLWHHIPAHVTYCKMTLNL